MRSARTRSLPAALLVGAIVLLVSAASAAVATIPLTGGEVDWGIKKSFRDVKHVKPPASRADSVELYLVARDFRKQKAPPG